jgi:hypothetical protein
MGTHPSLQVLASIGRLRFARRDISEPRIHSRATQILGKGGCDLGLALIAQPLNPTQLIKTP